MKNYCLFLLVMLFVGIEVSAQKKKITAEQLAKGLDDLETTLPWIGKWQDNEHFIVNKGRVSYLVDAATGKETPYTREQQHVVGLMYRVQTKGGEIYYSDGKELKQLTYTTAEEKNPVLSPDSKWVAFTRDNNLYAIQIETGQEVQYTFDGTDLIMNGYASWVYYEEILGRVSNYRSFWWSPDSKHIAFFRCDDTNVPVFPIYNSTGQHGFLENTRYPKAGDPNPEVKVGVVDVTGGKVIWADFNEKEDQYFGEPFWRPDGSSFLIQWMPREQNNLKLYDIDLATGVKKEIYDEKQTTWVDWITKFQWVKDGFMMVRDFDGWEQIYLYGHNGALKSKISTGRKWNTEIQKVDEAARIVYFTSRGEISTREDLYCASFNGKNQRRLTFGDYNHSKILISPNNKYVVTICENVSTPPQMFVVNVKTGKAKRLYDSKGTKFDEYDFTLPEVAWIKTPEGFNLPAVINWPANIEAGRKYPVIIQIYGGPNAGTVMDRWISLRFTQKMANEGIIRIVIDHRGSGHCGKEGMNYMHRNLGKWEMEDYISWVKYLCEKPFVDSEKVMITGGSYGGYVTAMALTYGAEYFQYGIAKYGVMDWLLYDSHYTERYMDLPKDNPEGYKFASVLTHVGKYQTVGKAMLRIEHGTMDDNVHMQNSIQLIDTLQNLNKSFEFMLFPNERHGWMGQKVTFDRAEMGRFVGRYLFNGEF